MKKMMIAVAAALIAVAAFGETVVDGEWTVVYPNYPKESCGLTQGLSTMAYVLCDVLGESVGVKAKAVVEGREPKGPGRRFFYKLQERAGRSTLHGLGFIYNHHFPTVSYSFLLGFSGDVTDGVNVDVLLPG